MHHVTGQPMRVDIPTYILLEDVFHSKKTIAKRLNYAFSAALSLQIKILRRFDP